ncbi:ABC transporter substrate-binding protein [Cohnella sp.]|uniref:ABC transporter substrate-binding protein n=1 Tax=Cohnella sp. TaxID=1883426 RepID=UPI00356B205F
MKKKTGWVGALLALMLLVSACGGNGNSGGANSGNGEAAGSPTVQAGEEPYELVVAFFVLGEVPGDLPMVQEEINKISKAKINTTVKLLPINIGAWKNQMNLMMTSGEKLDLIVVNEYSNDVTKGRLQPINDLLEKHGQGILEALGPDYYNATKIKGQSYAVPSIRDLAADYGLVMRKDLIDKYRIDVSQVQTLEDLEMVFKAIKDNEPNLVPITNKTNDSVLGTFSTRDSLGDNFGVLLNNGQDDLKVVNWFATEEYANQLRTVRKWYEAGYVLKDAVQNQESDVAMIKAGKAASFLGHQKPGYEAQQSRATGMEMVAIKLAPAVAKTSTVSTIMWGVPSGAEKPERSMQFLNLMYTDKDIINLLDWGIEGKHYVKTDNGLIDYPEGVNAQSTGYGLNMGWMFGNQFLSHVWKSDDPDVWKAMDEFNRNAVKSKALGFNWDPTPVKAEVTAVYNVVDQYRRGLESGILDPDKELPAFLGKLQSAGIDKIIAEKQRQLDEWAQTQE